MIAKTIYSFLFLSTIAQWSYSQPTSIGENDLIELALSESPTVKSLEARIQSARGEQAATKLKFDPRARASYSFSSSTETPIIQFIPVFESDKSLQFGIEQKLPIGAKISAGLFANQLNTADGFINNATQVGGQVNLEVDIWKNFLGRLDKNELRSNFLSNEIAKIKGNIGKQELVTEVRKIYWALVINELSLDLSSRLIKTSQQQLNDTYRQSKEGAADKGDVARSKAQVQSRQSAQQFFSYQKEALVSSLQSFIPGLESKSISIDKTTIPNVEKKALTCINEITEQKKINLKYSQYSKIIDLLNEKLPLDTTLAKATNKIDVKFTGRYQTSGVSNSHSQAFDNLTNNYPDGYQVGIAVSIPLGKNIDKAQVSRTLATKNQIGAESQGFELKLKAEHQKAQRSLGILNKAAASQAEVIKNLTTSYNQSRKKYRQARISLNTYVLEQDNLFNSELQLLDTKKKVINLLLDYFKIFPGHPCQINLLRGAQL